jgi:lipopolysaccharide biosynthesis protein
MKIAVHLHLFYFDLLDEMFSYLANFEDTPYDLFVTVVEKNKEVEGKIKNFKPNAKIFLVENRGYDVGPFVYFLQQIELEDYDLIWKVHAKRDLKHIFLFNGLFLKGNIWRKLLLNSIIGSKDRAKTIINDFSTNSKLGLVCSKELIAKNKYISKTNMSILKSNLLKADDSLSKEAEHHISGTMFVIRSSICKYLKDNYKITDFDYYAKSGSSNSLAHSIEVILIPNLLWDYVCNKILFV